MTRGARREVRHRLPCRRAVVAFLLFVAATWPAALGAAVPTFVVNSLADVAPTGDLANGVCETAVGNGVCTLRAAVMKANHYPGGGVTIQIPASASPYTLTIPQVIGTYGEADGDLNVTAAMTIVGAGPGSTVLEANRLDRLFNVATDAMVSIRGVTLRTGYDDENGRGGGAILNNGTLTLADAVLDANESQTRGGAIWNAGGMTVSGTVINGSIALGNAGAIYNKGTLTLRDTVVSSSEARGGSGGGIENAGTLGVYASTISGNHALDFAGGGITNTGTLLVVNSTISNNSASADGGGIYNANVASIVFSTVAGNLTKAFGAGPGSSKGGGIFNASSKTVNLRASVLAWNYEGATANDCEGDSINSGDYNYIQTTTGCFVRGSTAHHVSGADPGLESLADNGGPSIAAGHALPTRALRSGSPALDAIPLAECYDEQGAPLLVDGRGAARPANGACDIGAVEGVHRVVLSGSNLLRNGDAETAAGSVNGSPAGLPYWAVATSSGTTVPTAVTYEGYWPGHIGFPTPASPGPSDRGLGFFAGGADTGTATLVQNVDVSALAILIDAGRVSYSFSGQFGGRTTSDDVTSARAVFYDALNNGTGSPGIGSVTAADRANQTGLLPRGTGASLPAGTRTIEVDLSFQRAPGSTDNNAYADDLTLALTSGAGLLCRTADDCPGDLCTAVTCSASVCGVGQPLSCDDGDPLTRDTCDPTIGCLHTPPAAGPCTTDADCLAESDPCGASTCDATKQCVTRSLDGYDSVACLCRRASPAACAQGVPRKVSRFTVSACKLIDGVRGAKPKKVRRAIRHAAAKLAQAGRIVAHKAKPPLAAACKRDLTTLLSDDVHRASDFVKKR